MDVRKQGEESGPYSAARPFWRGRAGGRLGLGAAGDRKGKMSGDVDVDVEELGETLVAPSLLILLLL